ncbi:hypothetical protein QBC47DRAFT_444944 [Echria macrotheca]|uniref:Uncharacterized protein n=1 Tax=Echria macrotheca TaxID=438768 RepID=A0AAJ0BFS4_9PEZI|nr:hypothetical protein QBC47DRAFT_444944 [Echria macrotheca]
MDLFATHLVLIRLHISLHWVNDGQDRHVRLTPKVFAAPLVVESTLNFCVSLDDACRSRFISLAQFGSFGAGLIIRNYRTRSYFVYAGFEDSELSIAGLTNEELINQLDFISRRGYYDYVHVDLDVEVADNQPFPRALSDIPEEGVHQE